MLMHLSRHENWLLLYHIGHSRRIVQAKKIWLTDGLTTTSLVLSAKHCKQVQKTSPSRNTTCVKDPRTRSLNLFSGSTTLCHNMGRYRKTYLSNITCKEKKLTILKVLFLRMLNELRKEKISFSHRIFYASGGREKKLCCWCSFLG